MKRFLCFVVCLFLPGLVQAQTTQYSPFPNGMRVISGGTGVLLRNTPSLSGTCGTPAHTCTAADSIPPNTYGVIQPDPPVLDAGGWYWHRITFQYAGGVTGWVSAYPPYINMLSPPQMIEGVTMSVVADYIGPALTQAICINDGVNSAATLSLQPQSGGTTGSVQGTLLCAWGMPGIGNHKAVVKAVNNAGTMDSTEFQFAVNTAPTQVAPAAPSNLRITPLGGTTATQSLGGTTLPPEAPRPPAK